jgi:hypothetical protein
MKTLLTIVLTGMVITFGQAQNNLGKTDDLGRIALAVVVPEQAEGIPTSARQLLESKMLQIAVQNGLGESSANPRFCIVPAVNVLSKEVTPTAPPMQALNLEATFFIVDAESKVVFSQTSLTVKGVGQTEDKAYLSGLRNINVKAGAFKGFVESGKTKIIEYYNSQCDALLNQAQALAGQKKYEEALCRLSGIPDVCRECFDKAQTLSATIYQQYANFKCSEYLSAAKAAWANMDADKAAEQLGKITQDMACYEEASQLTRTITDKMLADGANVWNFKMKKYDDAVSRDRLIIEARRDVAMAWAYASYWGPNAYYRYDWRWLYHH